MGEIKHLIIVKFKEGVVVQQILEDLTKLAAELDIIKSFEWGKDIVNKEILTQGFSHVLVLTFNSAEDLAIYVNHPSHNAFAITFRAAIEKMLLLDYPVVLAKP
ncbi:stress-response A/B barrel domain-containing protein At5g22580 [Typha angustifolia]|uniref:stress-response A/B barrel domain-containing protein At5g22580 n=1 Tax=Typha angustifolia TaxID=59011 RepID=UPI003C2FEDE4